MYNDAILAAHATREDGLEELDGKNSTDLILKRTEREESAADGDEYFEYTAIDYGLYKQGDVSVRQMKRWEQKDNVDVVELGGDDVFDALADIFDDHVETKINPLKGANDDV